MSEPRKETDKGLWLDQTLRELPARRAPASLELRVLRELERSAARPWWLRTFAQWPAGGRIAFIGLCGLLVALGVFGGSWVADALASLRGTPALDPQPVQQVLITAATLRELGSLFLGLIPAGWVHAALAAGAFLYLTLFTLGAAAYRWLYLGAPWNGASFSRLPDFNGG